MKGTKKGINTSSARIRHLAERSQDNFSPWMNYNSPHCTADEYFKDISYIIDLQQLYTLVGTCFNQDSYEFPLVPLLLRIDDPQLRAAYDGNTYLFQVWYKSEQRKIFEQSLKLPIKVWGSHTNTVVYSLEGEMNTVHILRFDSYNSYTFTELVLNKLPFDPSQYTQMVFNESNFLVLANESKIVIADIKDIYSANFEQGNPNLDGSKVVIQEYHCETKILALFIKKQQMDNNYIYYSDFQYFVVFEGVNNFLDFNVLALNQEADANGKFLQNFIQIRDIQQRKDEATYKNDPVVQFQYCIKDELLQGVALRESGRFDIYYDMTHRVDVRAHKAIEIGVSFRNYYFKFSDGFCYKISYEKNKMFSIGDLEDHDIDKIDAQAMGKHKVQQYIALFKGFKIIPQSYGSTQTNVVVAHQKFISVFEVISGRWLQHIKCPNDPKRFVNTSSSSYPAILFTSGHIYCGLQDCVTENRNEIVFEATTPIITDTIRNIIEIEESYSDLTIFFQTDSNVYALTGTELHTVENREYEISLIAPLVMYNNIDKYRAKTYDYNSPFAMRVSSSKGEEIALFYYDKYKKQFQKTMSLIDLNKQQIQAFQTVVVYDFDSTFIFIGENSLTVYDIAKKKKIHPEIVNFNCKGTIFVSPQINYTLTKEDYRTDKTGLQILDFKAVVEKGKLQATFLKSVDVGSYTCLSKDIQTQRIGFIQSLTNIVIHPFLHVNKNDFLGAIDDSNIMFYRRVGYTLVVLTKDWIIIKYDIRTGKYISCEQCGLKEELSGYVDLHSPGYLPGQINLVLVNFTSVEGNDKDYFDESQFQTIHRDQIPISKAKKHTLNNVVVIAINDQGEVEIKLKFIFPLYVENNWSNLQQMYINDRYDRMICIMEKTRAFIYKKEYMNTSTQTGGNLQIKWTLVRQIVDFPFEYEAILGKDTILLKCFTSDFSMYVRISKKTQSYEIKYTETGETHSHVPKDVLSERNFETSEQLLHRFAWIDCSRFIIADQYGYERIINIDQNYQEEAYNARPLFNDINGQEWISYNLYQDRSADFYYEDTNRLLKRMYQDYKSNYYLYPNRDQSRLYSGMLKNCGTRCFVHSFTFLHWSLIDQLERKQIKLKDIPNEYIEEMIYNILPGGNTVLHKIHKQQQKIKKLFKICHPGEGDDLEIKYHIPFLPNFNGQSPIDLSLSLKQNDFKSIFSILKYLALYDVDHHSRVLKKVYHVIIREQLPEIMDYLDSRFVQYEELKDVNEGELANEIITSSITYEHENINQEMFANQTTGGSIKVELLDVPGVYHYQDPDFEQLFKELSNSETFLFFENRAIQTLIDFNFSKVREFLIYLIILPFLLFHVIFVVYMNVVYEHRIQDDDYDLANKILAAIQLGFSAYFLLNEFRQMINLGWTYITSVWNYVDLFAPSGVIIMHAFQFAEFYGVEINVHLNRVVLALSTFLMWMKLLSVLRIFRHTSYLIRTLEEVIYDMGIFLLVLLITIMGFGDSFLRLSLGNEEEEQFIPSFVPAALYTYSMILGGYDTEAFGQVAQPLVWIFWVLCTILVMIVMLNLLIAIISGTYERVVDNQDQASYQEMASLISENYYLIPKRLRENYAQKNKFLLVGTDLEKLDEERDFLTLKFKDVENKIDEIKTHFNTIVKAQKEVESASLEEKDMKRQEKEKEFAFLRYLLLRSGQQIKMKAKICPKELTLMTLLQIKEHFKFETYESWYCDGTKFNGCQAQMAGFKSDPNDVLYHCSTCNFNYCETCFGTFENAHHHKMEKTTFAQLIKKQPEYTQWGCDARHFKGCASGNNPLPTSEDYAVHYHNSELKFDLCEACMEVYRADN